ncbi:MAG: hypothetical protein ACRDKJ_13490 [Actinomycetota bacterium]
MRKRWRTQTVVAEDHGTHLILRPAPDDPIAAARGALLDRIPTSPEALRKRARDEERRAENRRRA